MENRVWQGSRPKRGPDTLVHTVATVYGSRGGEYVVHTRASGDELKLKDTARNRNRRFERMDERGDIKWSSRGGGVTYEPRVTTRREVRGMELNRVARDLRAGPYLPVVELKPAARVVGDGSKPHVEPSRSNVWRA